MKSETAVNVEQFVQNYKNFRTQETRLGFEEYDRSPDEWRAANVPMLALKEWIFDSPVPLESIQVQEKIPPLPAFKTPKNALLSGLDESSKLTYSAAVIKYVGMSHFHNGRIFRTTSIDFRGDRKILTFDRARYFDFLDSNEMLAYSRFADVNPDYRKSLSNPFDLLNRVAGLGILTLTVYQKHGRSYFLMHKRSSKVVVGAGLYHPVPAGEFTPSEDSDEAMVRDLNLRRNIEREYAEELLGDPDAQATSGRTIDYDGSRPYRQMAEAVRDGQLDYYCLGIGLDPYTWKLELLTVAVFRDDSLEHIFGSELPGNEEGRIISDIPFDEQNIKRYIESGNIRLGAVSTLMLAWRSRRILGVE